MLEHVLSLLQLSIILAAIGLVFIIINHFLSKNDFLLENYRWFLYILRFFIACIFIASGSVSAYAIYLIV